MLHILQYMLQYVALHAMVHNTFRCNLRQRNAMHISRECTPQLAVALIACTVCVTSVSLCVRVCVCMSAVGSVCQQ